MAWQRPTLAELVERISADFTSRLNIEGGLLRRSVVAVLARIWAGACHMLHGHLEYISRQILPNTQDLENLRPFGANFSVPYNVASYANGNISLTGTDGGFVPTGTILQRSDSFQYQTTADATIAGGIALVEVEALAAGEIGNESAGIQLTFVNPIPSVSSVATIAMGGISAGADEETEEEYRVRVLERMAEPPMGGADYDYKAWVKEIAGNTRVWVYPNELGPGQVTVRFVRDNDVSIIPDAGEVADAQAYVDARRPVTANVTVLAPIAVPLNFTIDLTPDTTPNRAAVEAELRDLLSREAEPGGVILLSHINEAISVAAGETDHVLSVPSANVTYTTGQIATMGTITWL